MRYFGLFIAASLIYIGLYACPVYAQKFKYTEVDPAAANDPATWETWGITEEDWRIYEVYMRGEGKYHYQQLDPVFVLGMIAKTESEKDDYAQKYAQQEFERTTRLLDFQERYNEQFNVLFGPLNAHNVDGSEGFTGNARSTEETIFGDRITLFVTTECSECSIQFKRIQSTYKAGSGVSIDLFFVNDDITDDDIREWAYNNGILPEDVKNNHITLNHDDRHASFGSPSIPASYHVRKDKILGVL